MPGIILTAEHRYRHPREAWHHMPPATWAWHAYPIPEWQLAMVGELPHLGETDATVSTHAYVNHGRWVADCPFCTSAQVASKTDHRFLCTGEGACANAQVGGAFVPVVWPRNADAIEAALLPRPNPQNRNWRPGETVKDLHAENKLHEIAA